MYMSACLSKRLAVGLESFTSRIHLVVDWVVGVFFDDQKLVECLGPPIGQMEPPYWIFIYCILSAFRSVSWQGLCW